MAASGAGLALSGSHIVRLFRLGGWIFNGQAGSATGLSSGAIDSGTVLTSGTVTSLYAARTDCAHRLRAPTARTDCAPSGTTDARWQLSTGGNLTVGALPVATSLDVLGLSAWVKSNAGLGNTATLSLLITEYEGNGTQLRQNTAASLTGPLRSPAHRRAGRNSPPAIRPAPTA
jgi:hypothetical protein